MSGLNICVCVKPVPDPKYYGEIGIDPINKTLKRRGIPTIIGRLDKNALEEAISLKEQFGGKVTVISMAPDEARNCLTEALAMGADEGYLISDRSFAGADTLATSYTLARAIRKIGHFDLILTGNESADGGTAQVSAQLGEWLEFPHLLNVCALRFEDRIMYVRTKIEGGNLNYEVRLPAILGVTREINNPRLTTVKGMLSTRSKRITILREDDLDVDEKFIGLAGSPTQPGDLSLPNVNRKSELLEGTFEEIVDKIINEIRRTGINLAN